MSEKINKIWKCDPCNKVCTSQANLFHHMDTKKCIANRQTLNETVDSLTEQMEKLEEQADEIIKKIKQFEEDNCMEELEDNTTYLKLQNELQKINDETDIKYTKKQELEDNTEEKEVVKVVIKAYKFNCNSCDFYCHLKSDYERHIKTKSHIKITNGTNVQLTKVLNCKFCNKYVTPNKSNLNKHIKRKHKKESQVEKKLTLKTVQRMYPSLHLWNQLSKFYKDCNSNDDEAFISKKQTYCNYVTAKDSLMKYLKLKVLYYQNKFEEDITNKEIADTIQQIQKDIVELDNHTFIFLQKECKKHEKNIEERNERIKVDREAKRLNEPVINNELSEEEIINKYEPSVQLLERWINYGKDYLRDRTPENFQQGKAFNIILVNDYNTFFEKLREHYVKLNEINKLKNLDERIKKLKGCSAKFIKSECESRLN